MERFYQSLKGKTVAFCGIGRSHREMIRIFCEKGAQVTVRDKRDRETVSMEEHEGEMRTLRDGDGGNPFFMEDVRGAIEKMQPLDRFLLQRILIDGEKPGDILDEAAVFIEKDETVSTEAQDRRQLAGYVYTRYNRARKSLQKRMIAMGYGK